MKKGKIITEEVKTVKLVPGGQALGELADGRKVFLWNALPGEITNEILVTKTKRNYLEGVAQKILKPASQRIDPKDEIFLSTSPWQIMDYEFELAQKKLLLIENLRQEKLLEAVPKIEEIKTDNKDFYYRNKMEYALYFDHESQKIWLAFHRRGSHQKIIARRSSIEKPEIWRRATEIIDELNRAGREAREFQSLMLRANDAGEISGGLLVNNQPHPIFPLLSDSLLGRKYHYSPNGFFQINLPAYEMALQSIRLETASEEIVDYYAGVGTIGLSVAQSGQKITLVESNPAAGQELMKNVAAARMSGIEAEAVVAKSEEMLGYIKREATIILDPPRAGLDKLVIDKILQARPKKVIYLSCNPATQARDLAMLVGGYEISKIIPLNFFPRTPHLEVLAVLECRI